MMPAGRWTGWIALVVVAVASAGCGPAGQVKVYPVKGRVLFEGEPMAGGGSIAFVPVGNQSGKTAGGEIKEDGSYEMTTYSTGDGSMVGDFRVVIYQTVFREPEITQDGAPAAEAAAAVPENQRIPAIYSSQTDSPLTATVEAKSNTIDLQLNRQ